jgi:hypothetical protein
VHLLHNTVKNTKNLTALLQRSNKMGFPYKTPERLAIFRQFSSV